MRSQNEDPASGKLKLLLVVTAMVAVAAVGYTFLPDAEVSAQERGDVKAAAEAPEVATQMMIDFALNLKSASGYTVFAERGVTDRGGSTVRGEKGDALRSEEGRRSTKDLSNSIDAIRQLPCTEVRSSDLTGKSFNPGVYCMNSAELNGEVTLDSRGDTTGVYIFRVAGTLNAKAGSSIRLENGAQGGNVFFVAEDAVIGDNASFRANILTKGDTTIGDGATVTDRVLSLGKVSMGGSALMGATTGTMEICKRQQLPVTAANNLSKHIFHFVITGAVAIGTAANPVKVQVGTCSPTFDVVAGPQTVTELNTGTLVTPSDGTFTGNFELTNVANLTPTSTSTLGLVNLATRTANVNVVEGGEATKITLEFTNRRTITGFIEICKGAATGPGVFNPAVANPLAGGDPDVVGFFQYTVAGVYQVNQQNPNIKLPQIFTVPAGHCSGSIVISVGTPSSTPGQRRSSALVTELARPGFFLESVAVLPEGRLTHGPELGQGVDSNFNIVSNPGGGFVEVDYFESANVADKTQVIFRNRSNPGRLKICKIAGPGIPINTLFSFTVTGIGALNTAGPQFASYGPVTRTVEVRAGHPAQGGTCEFIPGFGAPNGSWDTHQTFVNGTPVSIVENGISPNNTIAQEPGQLRASRIRVTNSAFTTTAVAGYSPNPDISPAAGHVARATVFARLAGAEVEFANFRFNPTDLKICKIAGSPTLVNQPFNFTVTLNSPVSQPGSVPLFPAFSAPVAVIAGPASTGGNCTFVNGSGSLGGALNQGSTITVTEIVAPNTYVETISCPTCGAGGLASELFPRTATLSGTNGLLPGINAVVFTNVIGGPCRSSGSVNYGSDGRLLDRPMTSCRLTEYDFDGDQKADPAIFTPSAGTWTIAASDNGYMHHTLGAFGLANDKLVPADYDGDGRNDLAIWRPSNGNWYIRGTTNVFEVHQWGEPGDVPQIGDFDGDGRSDLTVFRPSNGTWYIKARTGSLYVFQFGISTDKPLASDYDNDGRTDAAVFRNGTWYIKGSSIGFRVRDFGQAGDIPVPNDFGGDGATDLAVYRNGTWYIHTGTVYTVTQWGTATDLPVPADYDGDAKVDLAYFRPSEGKWYINRSSGQGPLVVELGAATDIPVQFPQ